MFKQFKIVCVFLLVSSPFKGTTAAGCVQPTNAVADTKSLLEVFRSLRDVVPQTTLQTILTKQVNTHSQVAAAFKYIQSSDFDIVSDIISETAEYQALLQELKNAGVQTEGLETVASIIRGLLYPLLETLNINTKISRRHPRCVMKSLASDIIGVMPRANFQNQLSNYLKTNENFHNFYKVMVQPQFQQKILGSLATVPIKYQVKILKKHYIDLKTWLNSIFKMFSWNVLN